MKILLVYQKTYFKSDEWRELLPLVQPNGIFLLSKNIFLKHFKEIKELFIGECVVIEITSTSFKYLMDFLNTLNKRYAMRFFPVCYFLVYNDFYYLLGLDQLNMYTAYLKNRSSSLDVIGVHCMFLYEFLKTLFYKEFVYKTSLVFFKYNMIELSVNNNYYY